MSKSSRKQRNSKSGQAAPGNAPKPSSGGSTKSAGALPNSGKGRAPASATAKAPAKKRGKWLTFALVIMTIDAIVGTALPFYYRKAEIEVTNPWLVTGALVVGLLGLAGVLLMWRWKRLGLYLFMASVAGSMVVGMLVFPSPIAAFHALVPLLFLSGALSVDRQLPLFE